MTITPRVAVYKAIQLLTLYTFYVSGTENVTVAAIQTMLRSADDDSMATTSFMYGKSTHNQVILNVDKCSITTRIENVHC